MDMIRVRSLARALVFRKCLYINQLFAVSHVKQLSMWLVIVLLSGVYTFSQFPLLLLMLRPGYTLYLITHLHIRIRSISSHTLQSNSTIECFFVYLFLGAPHSNELLTFYACLSSGFPALFIYIRSGLRCCCWLQSEIRRSEHLCGLRFSLCNLYVCLPLFAPSSSSPFLFFFFFVVSCLCPFRWVAGSKSIMLWGNCVKVVV